MRNMVEHGHTRGSSDTTVLSGCSSSSRFTRWISVPTPMTEPGRRLVHGPDDEVGGPHLVGHLDHVVGAFGVDEHEAAGVLGPEGVDVLGSEALVDRAVALPQQQGGVFDVGVVEAAHLEQWVPHPHVVGAPAQLVPGVAAQVLVGEEQDLVAPGHVPGRRPGPGPR